MSDVKEKALKQQDNKEVKTNYIKVLYETFEEDSDKIV